MNETELEPDEEPFSWEEEPGESASLATVMGSEATMHGIWDTPEEDAAWKHLEDF